MISNIIKLILLFLGLESFLGISIEDINENDNTNNEKFSQIFIHDEEENQSSNNKFKKYLISIVLLLFGVGFAYYFMQDHDTLSKIFYYLSQTDFEGIVDAVQNLIDEVYEFPEYRDEIYESLRDLIADPFYKPIDYKIYKLCIDLLIEYLENDLKDIPKKKYM